MISPGVVPTPGYDGLGLTKEQIQGFIDFQVNTIPSGRAGTPEEIAKAVTFLASDDSSFASPQDSANDRRFGQRLHCGAKPLSKLQPVSIVPHENDAPRTENLRERKDEPASAVRV